MSEKTEVIVVGERKHDEPHTRQHISDAAWDAALRYGVNPEYRETCERRQRECGVMLVTVEEWDTRGVAECGDIARRLGSDIETLRAENERLNNDATLSRVAAIDRERELLDLRAELERLRTTKALLDEVASRPLPNDFVSMSFTGPDLLDPRFGRPV